MATASKPAGMRKPSGGWVVKAADLGGSSAQSVILMFIVITLTVAQFRFIERRVNY